MNTTIIKITVGPFHHVGRQILEHLDAKSLMRARATCTAWYDLIESSPQLWPTIVLKLRKRNLLIHPLWKKIQPQIPSEDYIELGHHLMEYNWSLYRQADQFNIGEHHCMSIIYGSMARLEFFWPYLKAAQHPTNILQFVARFGINDVMQFLLDQLEDNLEPYLTGTKAKKANTPLHEAALHNHYESVKTLLPYYPTLPLNNASPKASPLDFAMDQNHSQIVELIQNWYNISTREINL